MDGSQDYYDASSLDDRILPVIPPIARSYTRSIDTMT